MTQGHTLCSCLKVAIAFPQENWECYSQDIKSSLVKVAVNGTLSAGGQAEISLWFSHIQSCLSEYSVIYGDDDQCGGLADIKITLGMGRGGGRRATSSASRITN